MIIWYMQTVYFLHHTLYKNYTHIFLKRYTPIYTMFELPNGQFFQRQSFNSPLKLCILPRDSVTLHITHSCCVMYIMQTKAIIIIAVYEMKLEFKQMCGCNYSHGRFPLLIPQTILNKSIL